MPTITSCRAYCGSVTRPGNEFEGTFTVKGTAESLEHAARFIESAPDLLYALECIADLIDREVLIRNPTDTDQTIAGQLTLSAMAKLTLAIAKATGAE